MLWIYGVLIFFKLNCTFVLCLIAAVFCFWSLKSFLWTFSVWLDWGRGRRVWVGRPCALARRAVKLAASGRCGSVEAVDKVAFTQVVLWKSTSPRTQEKYCHLFVWALFDSVTLTFTISLGKSVCVSEAN